MKNNKKNNISTRKYGGQHPFDGQNIQQSGINVISCKSLIHNVVRQDQFREGYWAEVQDYSPSKQDFLEVKKFRKKFRLKKFERNGMS